MFKKIYNSPDLFKIVSTYCSENNAEICLSDGLDLHSDDKLLILKTDAYYSSKNMHNPPPSIDCLILVKCDKCDGYDLHLVELRDINSQNGFNKENIVSKFKTIIDNFLQVQFKDIFSRV